MIANPQFGTSAIYRHVVPGGYDPDTGGTTGDVETDYPVRVIVEPFVRRFISATREDAGLVQKGDLQLTMAGDALPITPTTNGRFVIDGITHGIVSIDPERAGDTVVIYGFHARRGE
jgi:hypothetical protein